MLTLIVYGVPNSIAGNHLLRLENLFGESIKKTTERMSVAVGMPPKITVFFPLDRIDNELRKETVIFILGFEDCWEIASMPAEELIAKIKRDLKKATQDYIRRFGKSVDVKCYILTELNFI